MIAVLNCHDRHCTAALGYAQFLSVFDSIFSSIQSDIGSSLSSVNQIMQQVTKLYQTTVAPIGGAEPSTRVLSPLRSPVFATQMNQYSLHLLQVRLHLVRNSSSPSA